jgi:hypothetical protein
VRLFYDDAIGDDEAEVVESQLLPEGGGELEFLHTPEQGGYYFAKITQNGEDHDDDVWTAPVWIAGPEEFIVARGAAANLDDPKKEEIPWEEASDYLGQDVTVTGRIIRSFNSRNDVVFFNFDEDFQNTLSLVRLKSDLEAFGGLDKIDDLQERLTNQEVRVKGEISLYKNERLQLRLTNPDQLLTVREEAEAPQVAVVEAAEPSEDGDAQEILALLRELKRDIADLRERVEELEDQE